MMEFLNFVLNDPISEALAKTLLHFMWQGAVLAFVLFVGLITISKKHAELRYLLALAVLSLTLIVPLCTFFYVYPGAGIGQMPDSGPLLQTQLSLSSLVSNSWAIETLLPLLTPVWLAGVIYLSLSFAVELTKVHGLPHDSVIPADDSVQKLFEAIERRMGMAPRSRLLVSMKVDVPMVIGWMKPVVLLPLSLVNGLSTEQLEMLLAHELAHIRRQDYLVNLFQTFIEILLFFHPCVRWISNRVRVEREYCCDDMALKCCGDAKVYATALADAEVLRHGSIPQLAMAATGGDLKSRVLRIIGRHDCAQKYSETWHGIALAGLLSVALAGFLFVAHEGLQQRLAGISQPEGADDNTRKNELVQARPSVNIVVETPTPDTLPEKEVMENLAKTSETSSIVEVVAALPSEVAAPEQLEVLAAVTPGFMGSPEQIEPEVMEVAVSDIVQDDPNELVASDFIVANDQKAAVRKVAAIDDSVLASTHRDRFRTNKGALASVDKGDDVMIGDQLIYTDLFFRKGLVEEDELLEADTYSNADRRENRRRRDDKVSPKAMRAPSPSYPVWAAKRNLEGEVLVSFVVSKSGTVENIHFTGDANKYFKRSVELALRKWRFRPGMINGQKTEMAVNKIFTFVEPDRSIFKVTGSRLSRRI